MTITHVDPDNYFVEEYNVFIEATPSNLQGDRYYFRCPHSGMLCMNLYSFEGSSFRHRDAFDERVYYPIQALSTNVRVVYSIQYLEKHQIPSLEQSVVKSHYHGFLTKPQRRAIRSQIKLDEKYDRFVKQLDREKEIFMSTVPTN